MEKLDIQFEEAWARSAFKALDTECKGYLYSHEILEPVYHQGVSSHHTLDELIKGKRYEHVM
jgi:hypothetical protein